MKKISNSDLVSIYLSLPKTRPKIQELIKYPRVSLWSILKMERKIIGKYFDQNSIYKPWIFPIKHQWAIKRDPTVACLPLRELRSCITHNLRFEKIDYLFYVCKN
jgi:hypothetical protein